LQGHAVQENQVENDPADRRGCEQRAIKTGAQRHLSRHADDEHRDNDSRNQARERRIVGADAKNSQSAKQDKNRNRADERGQDGVAERVVNLRPDHEGSPDNFFMLIG
jgi:hypothetical protein